MYTQCPECSIAFRVTAKVLQQAAGKVRCGSCNHAFNALQYLSEEMPETPSPMYPDKDDASVDNLAETSRRLLETLDELAGPDDVRIEDTGVEWRVLDAAAAEDVRLAPDEMPSTEEMRFDDNTPLPDDFGDDDHDAPSPAPQRRQEDVRTKTIDFEDRQGDLALSEPEDWTDILEEVSDPRAETLEVEEELAAIHNELNAIDDALTDEVMQLEKDGTQPDLETDLSEIDPGRNIENDAAPEPEFGRDESDVDSENEETGTYEAMDFGQDGIFDDDAEDSAAPDEEFASDTGAEFDAIDLDVADGDLTDDEASGIEPVDDVGQEDEALVAGHADEPDDGDDIELAADGDENAATIPVGEFPETEEDATSRNLQTDEEAAATSGRVDDFAATLAGMENPEDLFDESSGEVETIIMEGEFIRSEIEQQRLEAENAARNQLDDASRLLDTYALQREKLRGGRRSYDPPSSAVLAAIVALGLLFVGQLVHNFRQPLATFGFFSATVAPIYRMLGSPITPDWDIKGWQFEATNGSVNEEETTLTIVSRIANRSDQPLPYPLVHVSLTNRFEDIMGSRILEPAEYLAGDGDPSRPVAPGENFNAVITVEDPSVDATGFKLNVCYRVETGTVRCAIEDFKN